MRQVMPHRNNIHLRSIKCKIFLSSKTGMPASVTLLPQKQNSSIFRWREILWSNNGLHVRDAPRAKAGATT